MNHAPDPMLLAHLDGELEDAALGDVARHLSGCAECRERLASLQASLAGVTSVIHRIDSTEPPEWQTPVREPGARVLDLSARRARSTQRRAAFLGVPAWRWAAGFLLVSAMGVSATILTFQRRPQPAPEPAAHIEVVTPPVAAEAGAVVVQPVEGAVEIRIVDPGLGARLALTESDGSDVRVSFVGGTQPRFAVRGATVEANLSGGDALVAITFPRSLSRGSVLVDGREVARISNGRIERGPTAGVELPLSPESGAIRR